LLNDPGHFLLNDPSHTVRPNPAYPYLVALVAAVGGFLFGFDLSIVSGAQIFLQKQFQLSSEALGFACSSAMMGCMLGPPLIAIGLSDWLGRTKVLMIMAVAFGISAIGSAVSPTIGIFNVFRILGGIAVGVASMLSPMYIAEIAPKRIRGRLVVVNQLAIVSGSLVSAIVAYFLTPELSGLAESVCWRWMFASECIPVILLVVGLFFVPESPRWLMEKGRTDEARAVLTNIDGAANAEEAIGEIANVISEETGSWSELFASGVRVALFVAVMLAMLQQFTGVSPMLLYVPMVFQKAGFEAVSDAIFQSAIMFGWNLFCTVLALWLVERLGRRPLLLVGLSMMCIGLAAFGWCFHAEIQGLPMLAAMFLAVGAFNLSIAPLAWLIMSEIFPNRLRDKAMAVAAFSLWLAASINGQTFPMLMETIENRFGSPAGVFWIYSAVCLFAVWFGWAMVKETKGKSLEEIGRSWTR
jgi:SP family arabinose:H+ symporter-like MFS transporter